MQKPQNYKNHIRFYPPHHFVFYPAMLVLFTVSVTQIFIREGDKLVWIFISAVIAMVTWLAFMLRQHYALTLQNRLVLMELRYRYYVVTGTRIESLEDKLSEGQLFALRFAPDAELEALTQKAIAENLKPDAIKKSIKNWKGDYRRV